MWLDSKHQRGQNSSLLWLFLVVAISEGVCVDWSPPGSSVHGIFRQEYWSGSAFPPAGDLPDPGSEPVFLASPVLVV